MLIKLVLVGDVHEDTPYEVNRPNMPSLAVYRVDEDFYVTENQCTHGNAMLSDGFLEGHTVICPFHDGGFDIRTGAPTIAPCVIPLKTYQTKIVDGYVCIET